MSVQILQGDVREMLKTLPDESVHCVVTSPPYWGLRDYGCDGQIGLEPTMQEHIALLVEVFRDVRRVLRKDGTCWVNYGDAYSGSWGAQSRSDKNAGKDSYNASKISANQIRAAQKRTGTGSSSRTPGLKPKDRMLLPARLAIALCDDGWWLRDEIVWHKPNPMPSSVSDRTTPAHEMVYLLTKSARYAYDKDAIREPANVKTWNDGSRVYGGVNKAGANEKHGERTTGRRTGKVKVPGGWDKGEGGHGTIHRDGRTAAEYVEQEVSPWRNKRSVWTVAPSPFPEAHFATFPPKLIEPCILAGCPEGGTVLDPFFGAGTTGLVAQQHGRKCIGVELNPEYVAIAQRRLWPELAALFE
jgi:DNA modification methylase